MKETSLCYIEKDGCWLMQHRVRKKNDLNHEKWVGVGGKFEGEESPEECVLREVLEETGLTLTSYRYCGVITFRSDKWEGEHMHLFTADGFTGELLKDCPEGELVWVPKADVPKLPIWECDRIFFEYMEKCRFFTMVLEYEGDTLVHHEEKIYC